jgi:cytochrome c-type protein NapC
MTTLIAAIRSWSWFRIIFVGMVFLLIAMTLVIGGAAGLAWTETESFCISCHEMRDNNYAEYKGTIHDTNRTGVRAICSDCHVPHAPLALIKRKIMATFELYHKVAGTIDTRQKFEAHRYELALKVWQRMKDTDSLECRNCHVRSSMSKDLQSENAQRRHAKADAEGMTCIDCHFGIAHTEPEGPLGPRDLPVNGVPPKHPSASANK